MIMNNNYIPKFHYRLHQSSMIQVGLRNRMIYHKYLSSNRPLINTTTSFILLTSTINNFSKPKPHAARTNQPPAILHYTTDFPTNILNYSIRSYRNHHILCNI
uniref:Uncharacterized protein n=1 Tax=Anguilla anguilla TaxID=7936 RepID=A0A0E9XY16_ANGAN